MRREDELHRQAGGRRSQLLIADTGRPESGERIGERLLGRVPFVFVLPSAPEPVVLLGDVRELEVEGEGAQDERLLGELEARDERREVAPGVLVTGPSAQREAADALDEI